MSALRVGIIGLGYWGSKYVRVMRELPGIEISFLADTDQTRLDEVSAGLGVPRFNELSAALENESTDAVFIVTPAVTHRELAQEALEQGFDVFLEKPFTLSVEDALQLVRCSRESGRLLYPGYIYAHNTAVKALAERAHNGTFGDLRYVTCLRTGLGPIRGDVNALWDLAPHDLTILDCLEMGQPEGVSAVGACFLQANIEDVVFGTLRYPNGTVAHIQTSWLDPYKVRQVTVVGSRRMAIFDDMATEERLRIYERGVDITGFSPHGEFKAEVRTGDINIPYIPMEEPLRNMAEAFVERCRRGGAASGEILRALTMTQILESMHASIRANGVPVRIDWSRVRDATPVG